MVQDKSLSDCAQGRARLASVPRFNRAFFAHYTGIQRPPNRIGRAMAVNQYRWSQHIPSSARTRTRICCVLTARHERGSSNAAAHTPAPQDPAETVRGKLESCRDQSHTSTSTSSHLKGGGGLWTKRVIIGIQARSPFSSNCSNRSNRLSLAIAFWVVWILKVLLPRNRL